MLQSSRFLAVMLGVAIVSLSTKVTGRSRMRNGAPFAIATWPEGPVPTQAWWSAAALGTLCSGLAFAMYYRLIYRIGASRAAAVAYLIPLFGVFWAWLLLDEAITATMAVACVLILVGVAMSQQRAEARAAAPTAPPSPDQRTGQ